MPDIDDLNTHTKGTFYEVFGSAWVQRLAARIGCYYTPQYRSWLNLTGSELSCLARQFVAHCRKGDLETLQSEIAAWSNNVNDRQPGIDWRMTVTDARSKLKQIYPNDPVLPQH